MYVPAQNRQHDSGEIRDFMAACRLATLVTVADGVALASHLPMLLEPARGPHGTLVAHLARANPQARALADGRPALAIFLGANAYVTPSWYESKREHGKVVPTWNYVAVQARGTLRVVRDRAGLHAIVDALTRHHEASRDEPWDVRDAPEAYVETQLDAIVGIELAIASLDGKWKLSQGRSEADVAGVVAGLAASDDAAARATARAMRGIT